MLVFFFFLIRNFMNVDNNAGCRTGSKFLVDDEFFSFTNLMVRTNVNHPPRSTMSVFHPRPSERCSLKWAKNIRLVILTKLEKLSCYVNEFWLIIPGMFLRPKPLDR